MRGEKRRPGKEPSDCCPIQPVTVLSLFMQLHPGCNLLVLEALQAAKMGPGHGKAFQITDIGIMIRSLAGYIGKKRDGLQSLNAMLWCFGDGLPTTTLQQPLFCPR